MNQHSLNFTSGAAPTPPLAALDALQARFALRVTAGLTERSNELGADVDERLRFARDKALGHARAARAAELTPALGTTRAGAAILGRAGSRWWLKVASVLPVLALVAGLVLIQRWQDNAQVSVAAEVDTALLSDDLPPRAYSDVGFVEFLKAPSE
jgi:hypothetical protein